MAGGGEGGPAATERSWWSRRFLDVLESGTDDGRLQRGRAYARQGVVRDLTVRAGEVTAKVQGGRPRPYRVSLIVQPLGEDQWELATTALATQPLFRATLLAGRLPHEVEQVFALLGLPLFPRGLDDLVLTCSCPDWGHPCKHAAATLYVLAGSLDSDPFLLLSWLGRDKGAFLTGLRRGARTSAEPAGDDDGAPLPDLAPPPAPQASAPTRAGPDPAGVWAAPPLPAPAPPAPPRPALFSPGPPAGDEGTAADLTDALAEVYTRFTAAPDVPVSVR